MWAWGHSRHLEHFRERTADKMPVFLEFILQWNLQSNIVFNVWLINTENKHSENCAVCQEVLRTWRRKGYRRDSSVSYSPAGMAGGEAPVEPAQGWAQSGLMGGGYGKLQSSLPSRVGLVMVQSSFCIHGDLALGPSENTEIHSAEVSSAAWRHASTSSIQPSQRPHILSRLLTTECKANAIHVNGYFSTLFGK